MENKKCKETCSCQCHIQKSFCCYIDYCCCPFLCCNHQSNTNIIDNSYKTLESPKYLIPQKEKDFFIRSEKRIKIPLLRNGVNDIFHNKSITEDLNVDMDKLDKNKIQTKYYSQNNIKPITNKKPKPMFKKIKVNKNNKEEIHTAPLSTTSRHKKSIDINNYYPYSVQRNKNAKQINDYEIDRIKKILVNKKLDISKINNKINQTNPNPHPKIFFKSPIGNKFEIGDKNDDIFNIKPNCYSPETNDNRKILQNLKSEIDKTKTMIHNLKSENKKLKHKINQAENSNINNSQVNNLIDNKINSQNNINEIKCQKEIDDMKKEIIELKNKMNEYENFVAILKKIEENKNNQIKELEIKLKFEKNFNNKKQKILELLFNFYQNLKKAINYDKQKVLLKDVIDIITVDDFQTKLNKFEKKVIQIIEDMQIKYGHCFACDIACCTSHVDKLKAFRKKVPKKK